MDLRKEAEERIRKAELEKEYYETLTAVYQERASRSRSRSGYQRVGDNVPLLAADASGADLEAALSRTAFGSNGLSSAVGENGPGIVNDTPHDAYLAEIDYKWNGGRARANSGEFIRPRWVPDEEVEYCASCRSEFDWVNRRHHCRHCGYVFCTPCSSYRALLPDDFALRDPQRVCLGCYELLLPQQMFLSNNIANHQRLNSIDVASTANCYSGVRRYCNMPYASTLNAEIRKAAYSVHNLLGSSSVLGGLKDKALPLRLIKEAKGLAFLTVVKGGLMFAPKIGSGLVIARLPNGEWSAPSAIGVLGLGWGLCVGAELTDYILPLRTAEAVEVFTGCGQITLGASLEVALGPMGRSGTADVRLGDGGVCHAFSYSHSRGLFAGAALEAALVLTRGEVNHTFYGRPVSARDILTGGGTVGAAGTSAAGYGSVSTAAAGTRGRRSAQQHMQLVIPPPRAAAPLYDALREALSAVPDVRHYLPAVSLAGPATSSASVSAAAHGPSGSRASMVAPKTAPRSQPAPSRPPVPPSYRSYPPPNQQQQQQQQQQLRYDMERDRVVRQSQTPQSRMQTQTGPFTSQSPILHQPFPEQHQYTHQLVRQHQLPEGDELSTASFSSYQGSAGNAAGAGGGVGGVTGGGWGRSSYTLAMQLPYIAMGNNTPSWLHPLPLTSSSASVPGPAYPAANISKQSTVVAAASSERWDGGCISVHKGGERGGGGGSSESKDATTFAGHPNSSSSSRPLPASSTGGVRVSAEQQQQREEEGSAGDGDRYAENRSASARLTGWDMIYKSPALQQEGLGRTSATFTENEMRAAGFRS